jgi:hypothetical protein
MVSSRSAVGTWSSAQTASSALNVQPPVKIESLANKLARCQDAQSGRGQFDRERDARDAVHDSGLGDLERQTSLADADAKQSYEAVLAQDVLHLRQFRLSGATTSCIASGRVGQWQRRVQSGTEFG